MDGYRPPDKGYVGVRTRNDELVERFVKCAILLGLDPRKMMIEEAGEVRHAYFYHSRIARMVREVLEKKTTLPGRSAELASCLVSGILDSKGRVTETGVYISRLDRADLLMLERLGVHMKGPRVMNLSRLLALTGKESLLAGSISDRLAGQ